MVNYNAFAKTFSQSRKNMKWEELEYFLNNIWDIRYKNILDIGCWNGRLLGELQKLWVKKDSYLGLDLSRWLLAEAEEIYPEYRFQEKNMLDLKTLRKEEWEENKKYDIIFFIASFHHLSTQEQRLQVLKDTYNLLSLGGVIYFTNWSLQSELNKKRYSAACIPDSRNEFWGYDFNIKIWEFDRYYHCFTLEELEYLFKETWFDILENREFENKKNFISIIKKTWE